MWLSIFFIALVIGVFVFLDEKSHVSQWGTQDKLKNNCSEHEDGYRYSYQDIDTDYLPYDFVVFDLETTGLEPSYDEIIEIGAIRFNKARQTHIYFQSFVKAKKKLPQKIIRLTGITQTMIDNQGNDIKDVLIQFRDFIGDSRLVTFNSKFDMGFIDKSFEKHGLEKLKNSVSCALRMSRRAWPNRDSYKLKDLALAGDFDYGKSHRALDDARKALAIYIYAVSILKRVN